MIQTQNGPITIEQLQDLLQEQLNQRYTESPPQVWCLSESEQIIVRLISSRAATSDDEPALDHLRDTLDQLALAPAYKVALYWVLDSQMPELPIIEAVPVADTPSSHSGPEWEAYLEAEDLSTDDTLSVTGPLSEENAPTHIAAPPVWSQEEFVQEERATGLRWQPWALGLGLGALLLGIGYGVTRPCVVGACEPLLTAETLADQNLGDYPTLEQLKQRQAQMRRLNREFAQIPQWSPVHEDAQLWREQYARQLVEIDPLIEALEAGTAADDLAPDPQEPATQEVWSASQQQWETAIAALETLPPDVYPALVRTKLKEYGQKLIIATTGLTAQQTALENLSAANEAAEKARTQSTVAESAEQWRQVADTWEDAIAYLEAIPRDTTPQAEKSELLTNYLAALGEARQRYQREQQGLEIYNQAEAFAESARELASQRQWGAANAEWQKALNAIDQVPKNSYQWLEARRQRQRYDEEIAQLERDRLRDVRLEQAEIDLDKLCTVQIRICDYQILTEEIRVTFTNPYLS
ncbi:MAG: hypothetical protein AAGG02_07165, partial [Cyanobacteria bacterium P01_H01_bin.15]